MEDFTVDLPWPPTGNHYVKHTRDGKHYVTQEAKRYFELVNHLVRVQGAGRMFDAKMSVQCFMWPPDRRRRDLDNAWKVLSDACTKAGVWVDDCQIDHLMLKRMEYDGEGRVRIFISTTLRNA